MNCPRCQVEFFDAHPVPALPELGALQCPQCNGHWLEQEALHRVEQVVEVVWAEVHHLPPRALQQVQLSCPRCPQPQHLVKLKSERDHAVVMDGCPKCKGLFLDGGELEAIQTHSVWRALLDGVKFLLA